MYNTTQYRIEEEEKEMDELRESIVLQRASLRRQSDKSKINS